MEIFRCLSCFVETTDRLWIKDHAAVLGHHGWIGEHHIERGEN